MLTALSLNLTRKHHPKIWGATQLPSDAYRLSAAPCGGVLVLCQHLVLYSRQGQQTGVALHPSVLPPAAPPPPLLFDARAMQEAGGPGPTAALYAKQHAMDVHPVSYPGLHLWQLLPKAYRRWRPPPSAKSGIRCPKQLCNCIPCVCCAACGV